MGVEKALGVLLLAFQAVPGASLRQTIASQPGFEYFYNLQYDEALTEFTAQTAKDPNSPDAYNHIAQTVLYREMYRAGMLSSDFIGGTKFVHQPKLPFTEEQDKQFHDALNRAMSLCQDRIAADPNDTGALYSLGVSYGLRGNYLFVVKKGWVDALHDATAARKLHRRVTELNPEFVDAKLTQGVNDYIVGSLPLHWKMFGFLA
jgi:tetratricopeptide (TPR) repeat protein